MRKTLVTLCLILVAGSLAAQEPGDHPLVGRYGGAEIRHQERTQFGRYEIQTGPEETEIVRGEVWMTLYDAPEDSSTYAVYATYLDFLTENGFEILSACEPAECPGDFLETIYFLAPFADHGNYAHPAPFTNGNDAMSCFLSAKREAGDSGVYVSIAIAAGWAKYPQYKLDVVEVGGNRGAIVSDGEAGEEAPVVDSRATTTGVPDAPGASAVRSGGIGRAPTERRFLVGLGSLRLRGGMAGYMPLDPNIAGYNEISESGGTTSFYATGFKNVRGPYGELVWFPNENLGFGADVSYLMTDAGIGTDDERYTVDAQIIVVRGGPYVRTVGNTYPATITLGFGGGVALVDLYQKYEDYIDSSNNRYLRATTECLALATSLELSFPIAGGFSFSGGMDYLFIPAESLTFAHDGGSDYSVTYSEPNLGGLSLRLGLALEL